MIHTVLDQHRGSTKVVLYTPDAPDGKRLREYARRAQMNSDFINNPAMRDYLRQRIALGQRNAVDRLLENGVADILIKDKPTGGDFLRAAYRTQVAHIIADADARTTTNDEADRQARWDKINRAFDIAGILLPLKLSIPLSLMRAGYALYSANEARMQGNSDNALAEFINSINLLLGAVADGVGQLAIEAPKRLYQPVSNAHKSAPAANTPAVTTRTFAAPAGMSAVQIDGQSCFYWNSKTDLVLYRDLFVPDPAHPGQLKAAGYGAPDTHGVWRKISPLHGGGNTQNRSPSPQPGPSRPPINRPENRRLQFAQPKAHGATVSTPSVITKVPLTGQPNHLLRAKIDKKEFDVFYNFEKNAFHEVNNVDDRKNRQYYVLKNNQMQAFDTAHRVTDAEREATLRSLDIDLEIPLSLAVQKSKNAVPIPPCIRSIWIGDQPIPDALISNMEHNANIALTGDYKYKTKLYLSNLDPDVFEINRQRLSESAPNVEIVRLEESRFYKEFQTEHHGKYYAQYQAALTGNGGIAANFASAADVLRYRLMFHKGGLYLDTDDRLLLAPGNVELTATSTDLLLNRPVSNRSLGMNTQYNNCIFGTQQYNPTLNALSEESYTRFSDNTDIYTLPRPRKSTHSKQQLSDYMKKISYVTGPDVLNTIVDEHLPELSQLREAIKLRNDRNIEIPNDMAQEIDHWESRLLPLKQIDSMGNAHSWHEHK